MDDKPNLPHPRSGKSRDAAGHNCDYQNWTNNRELSTVNNIIKKQKRQ